MIPDSDLARLPVDTMDDLRARLRDAHYTTYNTLNTIFTGGWVAYLLRRVLEMPTAQGPWLLILATLLVSIASPAGAACSGRRRCCALPRACQTR